MPSVFDLLDDIEKRPGMYLGWSAHERGAQLRDLEALLMGYGHAIARHGVVDPGRDLLHAFGHYLSDKHGWREATELGPIAEIRRRAANDDEAWQLLWKLLGEFRVNVAGKSGT